MRFVKSLKINTGDLVRVKRSKGYYHFGIAVDSNQIIHFTGPVDDSIINTENIKIRITTLDLFLRGDKLEVLRPYSSPFEVKIVLERAMAFLDKTEIFGKPYHLVYNNCEHFARYIYFGKHESKQVSTVANVLAGTALGLGALGTAATIVVASRRKKK
jgi:hypothetical protein